MHLPTEAWTGPLADVRPINSQTVLRERVMFPHQPGQSADDMFISRRVFLPHQPGMTGDTVGTAIQQQVFSPRGLRSLTVVILADQRSPVPLFDHSADAGNVTTGETDLYSDTTAAAQLFANGQKLEAYYAGVFVSSGTATREVKVYFAGTAILDTGALTLSLSSAWTIFVSIIRVSATVVRYLVTFATEGAALAAYTASGELTGLTLSNTNILKITGQAAGVGAATNDIVAKLGYVEWKPAV